jgi:hypothetical protein
MYLYTTFVTTTAVTILLLLLYRYGTGRTIRGDGNCHYRAVYIPVFARLFNGSLAERVAVLSKFEGVTYLSSWWANYEHLQLVKWLSTVRSGAEFESGLTDRYDAAMVRAFRQLVAKELIDNRTTVLRRCPHGNHDTAITLAGASSKVEQVLQRMLAQTLVRTCSN